MFGGTLGLMSHKENCREFVLSSTRTTAFFLHSPLSLVDISSEGSEISGHVKEPKHSQGRSPPLLQPGEVPRGASVGALTFCQFQVISRQTINLFHYLQHTQTLTLVTQWYNQLQVTILDVELGLVKKEMEKVRQQLDPALGQLTWAQDNLWGYIQSTRDLVQVPTLSLE